MEFSIHQTTADGITVYKAIGDLAPAYSAGIELSFEGVRSILRTGDKETYSLFFDRRQTKGACFKYLIPRALYPLNIYKKQARVGSVKFKRDWGLFNLTYIFLVEKRIFEVRVFGGSRGQRSMYLRENGELRAKIDRLRNMYDDKTVYNIWVNDMDFLPKPTLEEAVPTGVNTYAIFPEVAFVCDVCAAFALYYDIAVFKPFGELSYAKKKPVKRGICNPASEKKNRDEYLQISNPPTPEQLQAIENQRIAAERAESDKKAREEAKRLAAEKAAAEKAELELAKAETRRVLEEKLAAEKAAKEQELAEERRIAEEKAKVEAEAAEAARAEAERIAAEKAKVEAEATEAARIEAERIAAEKAKVEAEAAEAARAEAMAARAEAARIAEEQRLAAIEAKKQAKIDAKQTKIAAAREKREETDESSRLAADIAKISALQRARNNGK